MDFGGRGKDKHSRHSCCVLGRCIDLVPGITKESPALEEFWFLSLYSKSVSSVTFGPSGTAMTNPAGEIVATSNNNLFKLFLEPFL
jgi:hypothetical protein